MKQTLLLVSLLSLPALAQNTNIGNIDAAQGMPVWLGSYDATTTSKTNAEVTTTFATTTPFLKHKVLLVHNTGSVVIRICPVASSTGVVSWSRLDAGNNFGVEVAAGAKVTLRMGNTGYLAISTASSTATVDVWEML